MCWYLRAQIKLFMNILREWNRASNFSTSMFSAGKSDCRNENVHLSTEMLVDVGNSFKLIHDTNVRARHHGRKINVDVDYFPLQKYLSFSSECEHLQFMLIKYILFLSFQDSVMVLLDQYVSSSSLLVFDEDKVPRCVVYTISMELRLCLCSFIVARVNFIDTRPDRHQRRKFSRFPELTLM